MSCFSHVFPRFPWTSTTRFRPRSPKDSVLLILDDAHRNALPVLPKEGRAPRRGDGLMNGYECIYIYINMYIHIYTSYVSTCTHRICMCIYIYMCILHVPSSTTVEISHCPFQWWLKIPSISNFDGLNHVKSIKVYWLSLNVSIVYIFIFTHVYMYICI